MIAAVFFGLAAIYPTLAIVAATCVIPYERREWKAAFFLLGVCHALSGFGFDPFIWSYAALIFGHVLIMPRVQTSMPAPGHAALVRVPIHTWQGLVQACFIPWRFARYETRVIVQDDQIWMIRRGHFIHRRHGGLAAVRKGDPVTLDKPLSDWQLSRLQNLTGKRKIIGIRDCSALERIACS